MITRRLSFHALLLAMFPFASAHADFRTGQPADLLLGVKTRPEYSAADIAIDPVSKKVFVCDPLGSRVLRYASFAAMESDALPEAFIGQADEFSTLPGLSRTRMNRPSGIALDAAGRLWVADRYNHRILRFNNAASLATGAAASGLLGQENFSLAVPGAAENRLGNPRDVEVDAAGRLWVLDGGNNRILHWDNAASLSPGAFASGVLGQSNFTGSDPGTTASRLYGPSTIALEHSGSTLVRLWVSDSVNSRVLAFNSPAEKANGAPADKVLGHPDFTTYPAPATPTATSLKSPAGLALQGTDLWVGDSGNRRVLRYANAGAKLSGGAADAVLGQFNFSETSAVAGLAGIGYPQALIAAGTTLWISDTGNNRLVRHDAAASKNGLSTANGVAATVPATLGTDLRDISGTAIDASTGKLFVSDATKNRVVRYASVDALQTGSLPESVLGQPNFDTTTAGTTAAKMNGPTGIHMDAFGNLWVADTFNNRLVRFAAAAGLPNGAAATQVFGQASFTTNASATNSAGMRNPSAVFTETGFVPPFATIIQRLWVADTLNARVLRFETPLSSANGAAASGVLGQATFASSTASRSATGMSEPVGLAAEGNGRLWVSDRAFQRVLRFDSAGTKAHGASADSVLLQVNLNGSGYTRTPGQLAVSPQGRLFVPIENEHRVLWFNSAGTKSNGALQDGVLGQPDLVSDDPGNSYYGLDRPVSVAFAPGGRLWVADRTSVKRYTPAIESRIAGIGFNAQNRFFLNILGTGGEKYEIRSSTDLQNWNTVEATQTVPGTATQLMSWTAPAAPNGPKKFYRLQTP